MKFNQVESIFKATTLGAVVLGIGLTGRLNKPRSALLSDRAQGIFQELPPCSSERSRQGMITLVAGSQLWLPPAVHVQ